jgi:hypothetical protein
MDYNLKTLINQLEKAATALGDAAQTMIILDLRISQVTAIQHAEKMITQTLSGIDGWRRVDDGEDGQ